MSTHPVVIDEPGKTVLLMGNEAIARGAIEAGATMATAYPGTPSSEIGNTLSRVSTAAGLYFEWSVNEKIAFEVAYGASLCGQRCLVSMKHVGLNVALDVLNPVSLRGVNGGFVFVSTDDPSQHSSRTEQDNRWLAKQNCVPVLEPSSPQEAKDFTRYAFDLSERVKLPVMIRTVTRLSHMRSDVNLGSIERLGRTPEFDWEGFSYRVAGFEKLFRRHAERQDKLDSVQEEFDEVDFNQLKLNGGEKIGVIGVGFAFKYVLDSIRNLGVDSDIAYLKLATPHPLPRRKLASLLNGVKTVLVVEEVDPFVEMHVKSLAKDMALDTTILGRETGNLPRGGELSPSILDSALGGLLGISVDEIDRSGVMKKTGELLFDRMLTLCSGCPHRASIHALKKAVKKVKGDLKDVVVNGDIGCYGLSHAPPMSFEDTYFCMGASIGVSQGMEKVGIDTIAWIGDGTFFHSGIPSLVNAVANGSSIKIVVADNGTVAMTGFQPTPQSGNTAMGKPVKKIPIENIARSLGVDFLEIVDPYDLEAAQGTFERMLEAEGVAMVIARRACSMEEVRAMRPEKPVPYYVDEDLCTGCTICTSQFGCPALGWKPENKKAWVDSSICTGCDVCAQICPFDAILPEGS
ncbi:MAG: indolepyruvate ferredoxin oxidoreductase subunit alpha [Candidatus Bathyarchaeota archaeon]|jgi:indolepyruvate ferredoxin oxidoreductase alpha subunit|nr:indolepyruvate ferredoxin oxidoreductase subunit alpha [Candidatus Bathyarchaeota archaeon]